MKKLYLLVSLFLSLSLNGLAQNDCCTADPLFGPVPVSVQSSSGNGTFENLSACSCLATNEHDSYWFAFECTASGSFEMMITPENLSADFDFALYETACPCDPNTVVIACDYTGPISPPGPFVPTGIASDPMTTFGVPGATEFVNTVSLTAGNVYYLIADNITTNGAGFDIEFAGTAQFGPPPFLGPPAPPAPITGEIMTCPGSSLPYSVPNNPLISEWEWTTDPPGPVINGNGSNEVTVDWIDQGTYNLCVTASTGCETSDPFCTTVIVTPIITVPVTDEICLGGTYEAPNGETYFDPGTYDMTFTSYQGCDSVVQLILTPIIPPITVLPPQEICEGDCVSFDNQQFCETTVYEAQFTNWQGCDSTVIFNLIVVPNQAVINGGGTVSCNGDPVVLDGSLSLGGNNLTYEWTDPNGIVISTDPTILVTVPGDYTLTITSDVGSNVCTDSETTTVLSNIEPPENITATGGTLTCAVSSVTLAGNSTSPGVTYAWTGPGGFTSNEQNPEVSSVGTYILTVTGDNGCTGTASAEVDGDSDVPNAVAEGDTLTCAMNSVNLSGNSATTGVTWSWTGPGGFTSSEQNPVVSEPGNYTLTVTAPNGCSAQANASVGENLAEPDAEAEGGEIDCTNTTLTLSGNSTTPGVSWGWTGPGGFSSADQNPTVSTGGTYTLTVTAPNGCTAIDIAMVSQNADLPDASADGGILDCNNPSLELTGNSTSQNITYSWTGPGGFISSEQNPEVNSPGTYTLTVTSVNGCSSTAVATVDEDTAVPDASAAGGVLTCTTGSIQITGNSTTPGVTFEWTGPGGETYNTQNPTVSQAGDYTLTVTAPNGCTAIATANVQQDADVPTVTAAGGTLDCTISDVTIQGNSNTAGVTYAWTGPGGFTSDQVTETVTEPGNYVLTVTAPNNCTSQATAVVVLDDDVPDIEAGGNTLSCDSTNVIISANTTTTGVMIEWTGPGGFTSNVLNPVVSQPGLYTVTLTGPNGCVNSEMITVDEDVQLPDISATGGTIDCNVEEVVLNGASATTDVTYEWTGPNGFIANLEDTTVTIAGDYTLVVTASNGCTAEATAEVLEDLALPTDVDATGGILSCDAPSLTLTGNTSSAGVTFEWTGPGAFSSDLQNPDVSVAGTYVLTVTGANGCEDSDLAVVGEDIAEPDAAATGGVLTCTDTEIAITGTSATPGTTFEWTGPGGFTSGEAAPDVSVPGTYTLTVTASNGCTSIAIAEVAEDVQEPGATAEGGVLTCTAGVLNLTGSSPTPGVVYEWTGPGGFASTDQNPEIDAEGTYTLVVTAPNGCTTEVTTEVAADANAPNVSVEDEEINCDNPSVTLNGQSGTPNVIYSWTGPSGFTSDLPDPVVDLPGNYTLIVTAPNGCTAVADAVVTEDTETPDVSATGGLITCQNPEIELTGSSGTPNVSYSWTGPGGFTSGIPNPVVNEGGTYTLTVIAPNGCIATASTEVELDSDVPVVSATGGTLTCQVVEIQLQGTSNQPDASYSWTGPGGFTSNEQSPVVTAPGTYTLTVLTPSGCEASANAPVDTQIDLPSVSIAAPDLLTCDVLTVILDATASDQGPGFSVTWSTTDGNIVSGANSLNPVVDAPGIYTLQIINLTTGCETSENVAVPVSADAPSAAAISAIDPVCAGTADGSIVVEEVTGGTPPYLYALNNEPLTPQGIFTGLAPGTYTLTVQDASGCEWEDEIVLNQPAAVNVNLIAPDLSGEPVGLGDSIDLVAQVTIPADQLGSVTWSPEFVSDGCDEPCLSVNVKPSQTAVYTVTVTNSNGCSASSELLVTVDKRRRVFVPNAFSPNGDGINDRMNIFAGSGVAKINAFLVVSRWGETVYQLRNFDPNDLILGWDGTHRGEEMDPGIYVWYAEVEFLDGENIIFEGDIALIR